MFAEICSSPNLDVNKYNLEDGYVLNMIGMYYFHFKRNYGLMRKYYSMAIEKNNVGAMYNFGSYYQNYEKNYDLMKKYYLMAIEKEDSKSMVNLGFYYQYTEINDELMKKYYLMAVEKENDDAYYLLKKYYKNNIFEFYVLLNSIENKNRLITYNLLRLKQKKQVKIHLKISESDEEHECCICFDTHKMVITQCNHNTICKNCYIKIDRCPVCRVKY